MEMLKIANTATIEELNPLNFALKNTYISNLLSTALIVIPTATKVVGETVKVMTGFLSRAYIKQTFEYTNKLNDILKHSEGLALEITWYDFTLEEATEIGKKVMTSSDTKIKALINLNRKSISFYLDSNTSILLQDTGDSVRTIYSM